MLHQKILENLDRADQMIHNLLNESRLKVGEKKVASEVRLATHRMDLVEIVRARLKINKAFTESALLSDLRAGRF